MFAMFLILSTTVFLAKGITAYSTYTCVSNGLQILTVEPGCDTLYNGYDNCQVKSGTAYEECVCQPKLFDAIYECTSEERQCFEGYGMDQYYESVLSDWHSLCDTFTSTSFSTPTLRTPTTTFVLPASSNVQKCQSIETVCGVTGTLIKDCYLSYPAESQDAQFKSCACRNDFYSAASICEYDGNTTCFSRPATLASIGLWHVCGITAIPEGGVEGSGSVLTTPPAGASTTSMPITTPPSSLPASSAAIPTPTSSAGRVRRNPWLLVAMLGAVFWVTLD